jgi:serine protease Do
MPPRPAIRSTLRLFASEFFAVALTLIVIATLACTARRACAASLHDVIRDAQRKVVKIYGAGGVRGLEAYQSGILISPEGHVLTALSYVLDADDLAVVLDDGRKFSAELMGADQVSELAVLKLPIEDERLPAFDLNDAAPAVVGQRVLALSNLYNIAAGDEPVSVLQGVVAALGPLEARRGSFQSNYRGTVYILDAAANNPGAAGGALVDWNGRLVGVLGKELKSRATGAWIHYALPIDQIAVTVQRLREGQSLAAAATSVEPLEPLSLADLGLVLVPDVLQRTPPFVDSVIPMSPAARAGLRPDDLLVFVAGEPISSCKAAAQTISRHEKQDEVRISVLRDGELIEATLAADQPSSESEAAPPDAE